MWEVAYRSQRLPSQVPSCTLATQGAVMKHYRINKVASRGGAVLKKRDVLASDDRQAMQIAAADKDCPVCEVLHAGKQIGSID